MWCDSMNNVEKRLRALKRAVGEKTDTSFGGLVRRLHARGQKVPHIIVQPGETVEQVCEREGISDDMPVIAHVIVEPEDHHRKLALVAGNGAGSA